MSQCFEICHYQQNVPQHYYLLDTLVLLWDKFRSQIAELWFPYDLRIAMDRRRSQKIEPGDRLRLRSQTIAEVCFHMIAEHFAIWDPRSSAIIWKPALKGSDTCK